MKSISDDDLCSECKSLKYNTGNESICVHANPDWPATFDENNYSISCPMFDAIPNKGDNFI